MNKQLFSNNGINYYILNKSLRLEVIELLTRSSMKIPIVIGLNSNGHDFSY
jgi:hypothetical protein